VRYCDGAGNENEDTFFNQDIDYNESIRSPGWARLQKKKLKRIKWRN